MNNCAPFDKPGAAPITPVKPLKPCFWDNSAFVYFFVLKDNKYLQYVDNIIFGISLLNYPIRTVKATLYDYSGISVYFVYFIFI